jgi:hypothetical protein
VLAGWFSGWAWYPTVALAIDRLINRTLVYGLLTALLAGVYAGLVLILGRLFGELGGRPPSWAVAGATLAVAALFQPTRTSLWLRPERP